MKINPLDYYGCCLEVFQLVGGIIKYLEEISESESLWDGQCFVFDDRVSIKHGLLEGEFLALPCL